MRAWAELAGAELAGAELAGAELAGAELAGAKRRANHKLVHIPMEDRPVYPSDEGLA